MQRRAALKNIGGLLLVPSIGLSQGIDPKRRALRVAHVTDIHLKDKFGAPAKFVKCLHHLQQQKPDLVLNGGDIVFDMNKENMGTINTQWQLMKGILKAETSVPTHFCLGNHDIWWNENNKTEAVYGKRYSMDQLQLARPYNSFIQGDWKFILLDSVHLDVDGTWYIGKLGDEQFAWLENELKTTDAAMPVLIMSHIPILSATVLIADNIINKWEILGGDMHTDSTRIINLFAQYPNVKLCLAGHIHLRDKVVYNNVTYICNGAVSGAWWEGNLRQTAPGYGLIDLYADGTFEEQYVNYLG